MTSVITRKLQLASVAGCKPNQDSRPPASEHPQRCQEDPPKPFVAYPDRQPRPHKRAPKHSGSENQTEAVVNQSVPNKHSLSRLLVEVSVVLATGRSNGTNALREAATVYKVDTDAIALKIKQEFAAKAKAKKEARPVTSGTGKIRKAAYPVGFEKLRQLFSETGVQRIEKLATLRSRFGGTMYSVFAKKA